jgi:hypothetical protein
MRLVADAEQHVEEREREVHVIARHRKPRRVVADSLVPPHRGAKAAEDGDPEPDPEPA